MILDKKKIDSLLKAVLLFVVASLIPIYKVYAAPSIVRLSGQDRYKTSLAVLNRGWDTAKNIVIVNGENFPDGLCAAPLAYKLEALV